MLECDTVAIADDRSSDGSSLEAPSLWPFDGLGADRLINGVDWGDAQTGFAVGRGRRIQAASQQANRGRRLTRRRLLYLIYCI